MKKLNLFFMAGILSLVACQQDETDAIEIKDEIGQNFVTADVNMRTSQNARSGGIEQWMADVNSALVEHNIQLSKIEYIGADFEGATVYFNNRGNKQLSSDYVPNDPRNGTGTNVPYLIDGTELATSSGMTDAEIYSATVSAMDIWNSMTCSQGLELPNLGATNFDIGYVQYLLGFGGINGYFPGTIVHAGVLSPAFFDAIATGGGDFILGVTFTFVWIEDLDQDGKGDVAIKEIYMNDGFNWQDAPDDGLGNNIFDFETVLLHEVGHGLSQGHFGKAFRTNGGLHFAPAALMNAGYTVARREVTQTDASGHCSNWSNWPNN